VALSWSTIKREHVTQACEFLIKSEHGPSSRAKGLFLVFQNHHLPAKRVTRLAYCFANDLALDTKVIFASGEGILRRLRELGFTVERTSPLLRSDLNSTPNK